MHPFHKEIFMKGGTYYMTSYELIWRLVVLLLKNNGNESQESEE